MKRIFAIVTVLFLAGCASVAEDTSSVEPVGVRHPLISLSQLQKGLTRKEAQAVLGSQIVIGYELSDWTSGAYAPVPINNPLRTETFKKGSQEFVVDYYLFGVNQPDDQVTDDELVPLVFRNDRLIGTGWTFLKMRIKSS